MSLLAKKIHEIIINPSRFSILLHILITLFFLRTTLIINQTLIFAVVGIFLVVVTMNLCFLQFLQHSLVLVLYLTQSMILEFPQQLLMLPLPISSRLVRHNKQVAHMKSQSDLYNSYASFLCIGIWHPKEHKFFITSNTLHFSWVLNTISKVLISNLIRCDIFGYRPSTLHCILPKMHSLKWAVTQT